MQPTRSAAPARVTRDQRQSRASRATAGKSAFRAVGDIVCLKCLAMLWVAAMACRCERGAAAGVHGACLQQGADLA